MKSVMMLMTALLFSATAFGQSASLSEPQKAALKQMTAEVLQGCLEGVKKGSATPLPATTPIWLKVTIAASLSPDMCACQSRNFEDSITPAFFGLTADQKRAYFLKNYNQSECSVIVLKKQFPDTCPPLVDALTIGDKSPAKRPIGEICSCMQEKIRPYTAAQWHTVTAAAFAPKDADNPSAPPKKIGNTPLEQALAECRGN